MTYKTEGIKNIGIIGSDNCRYIFKNDYLNKFDIKFFVNLISPVSFVSYSDTIPTDENLLMKINPDNWQHRLLEMDVKKNMFSEISKKSIDYLIVDLAELSRDVLIEKRGKIYTYNHLYENVNLSEVGLIQKSIFDLSPEEIMRAVSQFSERLSNLCPACKIIVVKTRLAEYNIGENKIPRKNTREKIQEINSILDSSYEVMISKLDDSLVIDVPKNMPSYSEHEWGNKETYYPPDFYEYAINSIYNYILNKKLTTIESNLVNLRSALESNISNYNNQTNPKYALLRPKFDGTIKSLGNNTGNLAFWSSLEKLFKPDIIHHDSIKKGNTLSNYDAVIITDLIWIQEGVDYSGLYEIVKKIDTKIVLMSVGLQTKEITNDFKLHKSVVELLNFVQKSSIIGARGKYTKRILKKYGINETQIIGCPSMYYWNDRNFCVNKNEENPSAICNFRTIYGKLSDKEISLMNYFGLHNMPFVEQTSHELKSYNVPDEKIYSTLDKYLLNKRIMFYSDIAWQDAIRKFDFSIGLRFHGNVMALRAGLKSLFITLDSRTEEMTSYFNLPAIKISEFDPKQSIEHYYRLADYSLFNEKYAIIFDDFCNFLEKNGMKILHKNATVAFD